MADERWVRIERLFDEALGVAPAGREELLRRRCGDDDDLRREVAELLRAHDATGILDVPPTAITGPVSPASLAEGALVGHWRIGRMLGRGGMGEVYLATRADGAFEQFAALKLLRHEAVAQLDRFHAERNILARLEHPGIARLLDGGMAPDGRPYTVMEYVEGRTITEHCRARGAGARERLALFAQVCDAVAFAHRNLVIHRDLKPANILVDAQGAVKLLDFGIAKLLDSTAPPGDADTTVAPFTPDYAAPEQLNGQPVTTATDIYALGVLLFEMLTGERPLRMSGLPSAQAVHLLLERSAPAPSHVARSRTESPVPARQLAGDLDAIVAKCLRKEAAHRYETVAGLKRDLDNHLRREPVLAREGARLYVFGVLLRRYRWAVAGIAVLIVTLLAGLAATTWQARRANEQAARATATKDFLLNLFAASDPRFASDTPRAEITAKQLLDVGAARIEKDFADQPELQIELLGIAADIYQNLLDDERFTALQERRMQLAQAHYGASHPIVIEGRLSEIQALTYRQQYAEAGRLLAEVDTTLTQSNQDQTLLRAQWWRQQASLLYGSGGDVPGMMRAQERALALYEQLAPHSEEYAVALANTANIHNERGDLVQQRHYLEQAIAVYETAPRRTDGAFTVVMSNYARNLDSLGEFDVAQGAYARAEELARKTYGTQDEKYWLTLAYHARMLHRHGDRARAHALFSAMRKAIPPDWKTANKDQWALGLYAGCLAAEGRAREAIPQLERTLASFIEHDYSASVPVWRLALGDAYDRAGETDKARAMLGDALASVLEQEGGKSIYASIYRERWGRFLLDHAQAGDASLATAEIEFQEVLAQPSAQPWIDVPLAHAGLARISAARGDFARAAQGTVAAMAALERVMGVYDLRVQAQIWLVHSSVLLGAGDAAGARAWAQKALDASRSHDDPSSPAIAGAATALRAAIDAANRE